METAIVLVNPTFPTALADDYAHVPYVDMDSSRHSRSSSSSCSTREIRRRSIRASILGTQMFDSDYDPSSASDSNSTGQESSTESAVMEDEGAASDGDGSYHFCNLPSGPTARSPPPPPTKTSTRWRSSTPTCSATTSTSSSGTPYSTPPRPRPRPPNKTPPPH